MLRDRFEKGPEYVARRLLTRCWSSRLLDLARKHIPISRFKVDAARTRSSVLGPALLTIAIFTTIDTLDDDMPLCCRSVPHRLSSPRREFLIKARSQNMGLVGYGFLKATNR